jgi:hypothetical protein
MTRDIVIRANDRYTSRDALKIGRHQVRSFWRGPTPRDVGPRSRVFFERRGNIVASGFYAGRKVPQGP